MKSRKLSMLFYLFVIGMMFTACSSEEPGIESIEALRGGPGGGGPNGQGTDGNVASLSTDVLQAWTTRFLETERYAAGMRPNASARAMAYINLAAYETALPGMRNHISNTKRLQGFRIDNREMAREIDFEIALNTVFARTIDHFLINVPDNINQGIFQLETAMEAALSTSTPDKVTKDSKKWGEYVANQVIKYSQSDKKAEEQILEPQPLSYEPPTGDGYWTYSADPERALFPYWGTVRTFVISPSETTTIPPIDYNESPNSAYFAQMQEANDVNNDAKNGNQEQLWIAEFWSDDVEGLMMSPPARQLSIANQLINQFDLNLQEALTLFVKLGFSLNDAAVSTWKYKYEHMVMRPSEFIHDFIDPTFQTNLYRLIYWPNPSFPGYPSGHSCFSSAAGGVFIDYFGNQINFTDRTHEGRTEFLGEPRTYSSIEEMVEEGAFSRIPLGVHVRMDCEEGQRLGYEISDAINALDLRRNPN